MIGYILDTKYKAVGILSSNSIDGLPIITDNRKQLLLNGYSSFTLEIPANHKQTSLLENEGYIVLIDMKNGHELYRIKNIVETHGDQMKKTVRCELGATADLLGQRIRPVKYISQNLKQVMIGLLANTGWVLGDSFFDDIVSIEFNDYPTALEAIHTAIAQFGAEIQFEVIFDGIRVVKKVVNLYLKRGEVTNKIVEYGHNLQGLTREENSDQLVTSMIGVGKEDVNGNRIVIGNASVTPPEGYEIIGDAVVDNEALDKWFDDGQHREGYFNDSNAQSPLELYKNTLAELKKYNKPIFTYTVEMVNLEQLTGYGSQSTNIGDTIRIKDRTFEPPLYLDARVLEKESSITEPDKGRVLLGEFVLLNVKAIAIVQQLQRKINIREEEWNKALEEARKAQDAVDAVKDNIVYKCEVFSSDGLFAKNGELNTLVFARVYKGKDEITTTLLNNAFTWTKFDKDGIEDVAWGIANANVGHSFQLFGNQVYQKVTFTCDVDTDLIN